MQSKLITMLSFSLAILDLVKYPKKTSGLLISFKFGIYQVLIVYFTH